MYLLVCIAAFAVSELTAFAVSVYWQHLLCLCNVYWQQLIYELAVVCICWQHISPLSFTKLVLKEGTIVLLSQVDLIAGYLRSLWEYSGMPSFLSLFPPPLSSVYLYIASYN